MPKAYTSHKLKLAAIKQTLNSPCCLPILNTQGDDALRLSLTAPCFPLISAWERIFLSHSFRAVFPEGSENKAYFLQTCWDPLRYS